MRTDERTVGNYLPPDISNPGNLIVTHTGGGRLGNNHAHSNEAPYPEDLAEFFLRTLCPPNGTVLDCFSGSGTTVAVAERLGMHGIGIDLRRSQCLLGRRRIDRPHSPVQKVERREESHPLFDEIEEPA